MMQSQVFGHSWPIYDAGLQASDPFELPPVPFSSPWSFLASSADEVSMMDFEALEAILNSDQMEGIYYCLGMTMASEEAGSFSFPSMQSLNEVGHGWSPGSSFRTDERSSSMDVLSDSAMLTLPSEGTEIDNALVLCHLLKAYGEAMDCGQRELVEVMAKRIVEKSNPLGAVHERLAFHLLRYCENEVAYIEQESSKNFKAALAAFYQAYPYGRFAHLAANCAVIESIPTGTGAVRIVDFDLGEGIQWAPMIDSIGRRCRAVKLTCVIHEEEDSNLHCYSFEQTERLLLDHGRLSGVNLIVERVRIEQLGDTLRESTCAGEWTVFNCMVGLPHSGRDITRRTVVNFVRAATEFLSDAASYYGSRRGILVIGEGTPSGMPLGDSSSFGEFFEKCLNHFCMLLESMEEESLARFPVARIAMESLFASPFISVQRWLQRWEELRNGLGAEVAENCPCLDGLAISGLNLMEARELIREKRSFDVKIAEKDNAMVLEYRGNPMVRVSTWDCKPEKL